MDDQLTIDDVSGPAVGLLTNAVSARVGDALLTLAGGSSGCAALEITGATTGTEADFPTHVSTARLQPSPSTNAYMQVLTGITGFEVADQGLSPLLQVEDDETKSYSRLISVTRAASGGTVGAVLKNTAGTGVARLQLDANASGGLAQLEVASGGGCSVRPEPGDLAAEPHVRGCAAGDRNGLGRDRELRLQQPFRIESQGEHLRRRPARAASHFRRRGGQEVRQDGRGAQGSAGIPGPGFRGGRRHRIA